MATFKIFGFEIRKNQDELGALVPAKTEDGTHDQQTYGSGAAMYGYSFDIEGKYRNEAERIQKYRSMSMTPEIDMAVEEITAESIVIEDEKPPMTLTVFAEKSEIPDAVKKSIVDEFDNVVSLLRLNTDGHDMFRRWYVDGRYYAHLVVDEANVAEGIKDIRQLDSRKTKKIREIVKTKTPDGVEVISGTEEYFIYNDKGLTSTESTALRLSPDVLLYAPSGLVDDTGNVISYIHKAIKPYNQLRYMEDAVLIYTLSRAPQRRAFYIDVADMPKQKAEQYIQDVMNRYKNKVVYNNATGEVDDARVHTSLLEDYWLPRRCFSLDTKVKLLDGRDVSIGDLATEYEQGKKNWTYSVSDDGKVVPGLITWAGTTMKNAQVVDVHLDNGEVITCTPDHKFITLDGQKIQAQDLAIGTDLMPIDTKDGLVYDIYEGMWVEKNSMIDSFMMKTESVNSGVYSKPNWVAVSDVVFREDRMDVGTLTVDGDELHHSYHNYALSAGVFVMNSNGRTTEITTLPGDSVTSQMDNIMYFMNKLFASLNLPQSRVKADQSGFNLGRASEISRDEVKFSKFINRLRIKFAEIPLQALRVQLILKGIIAPEDWTFVRSKMKVVYQKDNFFSELKENEILQGRIGLAEALQPFVGSIFSQNYVKRNIFRLSDEEVESMDEEIAEEQQLGVYNDPNLDPNDSEQPQASQSRPKRNASSKGEGSSDEKA